MHYTFCLYGVRLRSSWRLPCPQVDDRDTADIELIEGERSAFIAASRLACKQLHGDEWFSYAELPDGSDYLRWTGLFEFLISADGARIACCSLRSGSVQAFHTYLLGQVISFALLKRGIEPLHSTIVVVNGGAIGFLGDSGYGKSSLAAAFLQAGYPLLTDDMLVMKEHRGEFFAYPGLPRIKLFANVAKAFMRNAIGTPMNPQTSKLVIPLGRQLRFQKVTPLKALYVLPAPGRSQTDKISIRKRRQREAFLDVIRNTFNSKITTTERLRQQFALATRLSSAIPFKSLSYPRRLSRLPGVVEKVCADLDYGNTLGVSELPCV